MTRWNQDGADEIQLGTRYTRTRWKQDGNQVDMEARWKLARPEVGI